MKNRLAFTRILALALALLLLCSGCGLRDLLYSKKDSPAPGDAAIDAPESDSSTAPAPWSTMTPC